MSFIGSPLEIKKFAKTIDRLWPHNEVLSLMDARFSPDSPLGGLTERQRKVLLTAFGLGYYDLPRKIDSPRTGKAAQHPRLYADSPQEEGRT